MLLAQVLLRLFTGTSRDFGFSQNYCLVHVTAPPVVAIPLKFRAVQNDVRSKRALSRTAASNARTSRRALAFFHARAFLLNCLLRRVEHCSFGWVCCVWAY
jgi:hypothetical protein